MQGTTRLDNEDKPIDRIRLEKRSSNATTLQRKKADGWRKERETKWREATMRPE